MTMHHLMYLPNAFTPLLRTVLYLYYRDVGLSQKQIIHLGRGSSKTTPNTPCCIVLFFLIYIAPLMVVR